MRKGQVSLARISTLDGVTAAGGAGRSACGWRLVTAALGRLSVIMHAGTTAGAPAREVLSLGWDRKVRG